MPIVRQLTSKSFLRFITAFSGSICTDKPMLPRSSKTFIMIGGDVLSKIKLIIPSRIRSTDEFKKRGSIDIVLGNVGL